MTRFSRTQTATLAVFGIFCLSADGVLTAQDGFIEGHGGGGGIASVGGEEGPSLLGVPSHDDFFITPNVLQEQEEMMKGAMDHEKARLQMPKLLGLKSLVVGLVVFALLATLAKIANVDRDSKLRRGARRFFEGLDTFSDFRIAGESLDVATTVGIASSVLMVSGVFELLRSFLRRRAAKAGVSSWPPLRGAEHFILGWMIFALSVGLRIDVGSPLIAMPLILVGAPLLLSSIIQRRKYLKEQRDIRHDVRSAQVGLK